MRIYLAASLFTPFDRQRNARLAKQLTERGHEVFLPQSLRTPEGLRPAASEIFTGCVRGVDDADLVIAIVDGADVDSGTAWELGYAYARGKPMIAFRTDYRAAEQGPVNIMIEFGSDSVVRAAHPFETDETAIESLLAAVDAMDKRDG